MKINKNSLQARVQNLSVKKGVPSNVILQSYFFDAFIKRLAYSKYSENFIFKGGFLLSTSLGIDYRSTMDIDFLISRLSLEKDIIEKVFKEIIAIDVDDWVEFDFNKISNIREEDQYGGFNISLIGKLENIKVPVNIDLATGDPITPSFVLYTYKCMFSGETINFQSYNYETIISEKLQTVLSRGMTNSRSKDFYDLYIITKLKYENINKDVLFTAFQNTCKYRNTYFSKERAFEILSSLSSDKNILTRWNAYTRKNEFAHNIEFINVIESINKIIEVVYKN